MVGQLSSTAPRRRSDQHARNRGLDLFLICSHVRLIINSGATHVRQSFFEEIVDALGRLEGRGNTGTHTHTRTAPRPTRASRLVLGEIRTRQINVS